MQCKEEKGEESMGNQTFRQDDFCSRVMTAAHGVSRRKNLGEGNVATARSGSSSKCCARVAIWDQSSCRESAESSVHRPEKPAQRSFQTVAPKARRAAGTGTCTLRALPRGHRAADEHRADTEARHSNGARPDVLWPSSEHLQPV